MRWVAGSELEHALCAGLALLYTKYADYHRFPHLLEAESPLHLVLKSTNRRHFRLRVSDLPFRSCHAMPCPPHSHLTAVIISSSIAPK